MFLESGKMKEKENKSNYQTFKVLRSLLMGFIFLIGWTGSLQASAPVNNAGSNYKTPLNDKEISDISDESLLSGNIKIIEQNEKGLILELSTSPALVLKDQTNDSECQILSIDGYGFTTQAGWPQLPLKGSSIGIPSEAEPTLHILDYDSINLPGNYDLCPVAEPKSSFSLDGEVLFEGYQRIQVPSVYTQAEPTIDSLAEISSTAFFRSQRLVQLLFYPYQYKPLMGQLVYYPRIRVRLDFNTPFLSDKLYVRLPSEDSFENVIKNSVINYDQASRWRLAPEITQDLNIIKNGNQPVYKILTDTKGIYRISYSSLFAAGITEDELRLINPFTFRIENQATEIAIFVAGEQDGKFDPADFILFYGEDVDTIYTDTNVYWLSWGGEEGLRMSQVDGGLSGSAEPAVSFPTTVHLEEDHIYLSSRPSGIDNDRWCWDYIFATTVPVTNNYPVSLNPQIDYDGFATIRALFKGYQATPYHHSKVYLNGNLINDATWLSESEHSFSVDVPQHILKNGENILSVEAPVDQGISRDIFYINQFEIDYHAFFMANNGLLYFNHAGNTPREFSINGFETNSLYVFDVTNSKSPSEINNITTIANEDNTFSLKFEENRLGTKKYLAISQDQWSNPTRIILDVPSNLHSSYNMSDNLIITHSDFLGAAQQLADYHMAQGIVSTVVDVQDIYDEFNMGIIDVEAIREFIQFTYNNWSSPKPAYVLLFGDGNYDFKDNLQTGEKNFIPPYLANVDPWIGETAADNRYVTVSGNDFLPDLHLGRLPIKTVSEAYMVVDKIINYESNSATDEWNSSIRFIADNSDSAGNFANLSDSIINSYLPTPYNSQKIYYKLTHPTIDSVKSAINNGFNQGSLLINYIGHSAYHYWASENFLNLGEVDLLNNSTRLPFIVPMTCMEGYYIYPSPSGQNRSSLGEYIVKSSPNGAIASWSPTGFGVATGHDLLNKGLFDAIFKDDVIALGPATTQAKLNLYTNSYSNLELLDTYILFGDPALKLNVVPAELSLTQTVFPGGALRPGDTITYTLNFANTGSATAHHVVIEDVLPAMLEDVVISSSGVAVNQRDGTRFIWDLADMALGQSGSITITAKIAETFTGTITNSAAITTSAREMDKANNIPPAIITLVDEPTSLLVTSFTVVAQSRSNLLEWQTANEINVVGFNIFRSESPDNPAQQVNATMVEALSPGTNSSNSYTYDDVSISSGITYYYWLQIITNANQFMEGPLEVQSFSHIFIPLVRR